MIGMPPVKAAVSELQRWVGYGARNIAILSVVVPSSLLEWRKGYHGRKTASAL